MALSCAIKNLKQLGVYILSLLHFLFLLTIFCTTSVPVYVFRVLVISFAKAFRPNLGDIFSGKSCIYLEDFFATTNSRSNVVLTMIHEGSLTFEEVQKLVIKNWISDREYKNLQRYPVKWMGFAFWKNIPKSFQVNDYVHKHSGMESQVTDKVLCEFVETLLNSKFPKHQSPWELHVMENYKPSEEEKDAFGKAEVHSALILKWHHCLVDGTGVMTALVEGLIKQNYKRQRETPVPQRTVGQNLFYLLTFPIVSMYELVSFLSQSYVSTVFKITDDKKEWHQVYARSGIISNQLIKNVKNAFGVSYTSVLLSAISAAVHNTQLQNNEPIFMLSVLPAKHTSKRRILDNHMDAATFHLCTSEHASSDLRLQKTHQLFEKSRRSAFTIASHYFPILAGANLLSINNIIIRNRMIPIALTNIAGVPEAITLNQRTKWVHTRLVTGSLSGVCGLVITAFSHGANTELHIAAERALMTKEEAQAFVWRVKKEIDALGMLLQDSLQHKENSKKTYI